MKTSNKVRWLLACGILTNACSQSGKEQGTVSEEHLSPIEQAMLFEPSSYFYIDAEHYPSNDPALPIGVFDSGTGGLTVLNSILDFDGHDNATEQQGKDGNPDFERESFIYLADQANMPYGNYFSAGKSDLLIEHGLKDAGFLLSSNYYANAADKEPRHDKPKVKAIVIACNTATAYAKSNIEAFVERSGIPMKIIGVIDAGAKGALEMLQKGEDASIGAFATVGTIASGGYERTIMKWKDSLSYTGNIEVFNQGGHGIAEAVDEEPDYVLRQARAPRDDYRGPSLDNKDYQIDRTLMDIYRFDFSGNKMLCDNANTDDCEIMQINAPENYVRYHLVSLMEKIRTSPKAPPLKALVLGCTHYPYLTESIKETLGHLYNYKRDGKYLYRHLMAENVHIIDPAVNVSKELYAFLREHALFNGASSQGESRFFITVPNKDNANVVLDEAGRFTYDYKYGRDAGQVQEYVKTVPFDEQNISKETYARFKTTIPTTYKLIESTRLK